MSNENSFIRKRESIPKKFMVREFYFIETRAILRNRLRESVGAKNMKMAWKEYQAEHSESPKLRTYTKIVKV